MRIYILILLTFVYGSVECYKLQQQPISRYPASRISKSIDENKLENHSGGVWKKHTEWKSYWMKEWTQKTVYVPIWKKIWAPVEISKWIPIAKVPNGQKH